MYVFLKTSLLHHKNQNLNKSVVEFVGTSFLNRINRVLFAQFSLLFEYFLLEGDPNPTDRNEVRPQLILENKCIWTQEY